MMRPNVSYCDTEKETHYKPTYYISKFTLKNGKVAYVEGKGALTSSDTSTYKSSASVIELTKHCTSIPISAFCISSLSTLSIEDGLTSIPDYAFHRSGLSNIHLPNTLLTIGQFSFSSYLNIKSITVPNSVKTLGYHAFSYNYQLKKIEIGSGITKINEFVFYQCTNLESATIHATTPPNLGRGFFSGYSSAFRIYVPSESVDAYKTATNWKAYASIIEPIQTE